MESSPAPVPSADTNERVAQLEAVVESLVQQLRQHEEALNKLQGKDPQQVAPAGAPSAVVMPDGTGDADAVKDAVKEGKQERHLDVDMLESMEAGDEWYEVERSTWGVAMFIGLEAVGVMPSVSLLVLSFVNILAQFVFVSTLYTSSNNFVNNVLPSVEDMSRWRYTEGHSLNNVYAGYTLAQRVCDLDEALSVAVPQSTIVNDAKAYRHPGVLFGLPDGVVLATAVILLWFISMSTEFTAITRNVRALWAIPVSETRITIDAEDKFTYASMSLRRKLFLAFFLSLRLGIAITLLIVGLLWLAATSSMENLVLNAAALAFILDLDDLLFDAVGPRRVKRMINNMKPLPLPKQLGIFGIGQRPLWNFVIGGSLIIYAVASPVLQTYEDLGCLDATLCSGKTNRAFSWSDNSGGVGWTDTSPLVSTSFVEEVDPFYRSRELAIKELVHDITRRNPTYSANTSVMEHSNVVSLRYASMLSVGDAYSTSGCEDNTTALTGALPLIRFLADDDEISSCEDLFPEHCNNPSLEVVRAICPDTCKCKSVRNSPLRRSGCPTSCERTHKYMNELASIECVDLTEEELEDQYKNSARQLKNTWGHANCSKAAMSPEQCLPIEQATVGTFIYFCPVSCNCTRNSDTSDTSCPSACATTSSSSGSPR